MALNYLPGIDSQSAITASTSGDYFDARGYSKIAVNTIFATCSGTGNTGSLVMQTCNNKGDDDNWVTVLTIWSHADVVDASTDTYFDYLPDATASLLSGFGRYLRFRFIGTGTFAATYTIYWELKE